MFMFIQRPPRSCQKAIRENLRQPCTTIIWTHKYKLENLDPNLRNQKFKTENLNLKIQTQYFIDQDWSYNESLSGRPGAWLVKKIFFVCMQSQNFKKDFILKFKMILRTSFVFMIAFMVYE